MLTRRCNQAGFKKSGRSCPNQLIGGIIFCDTAEGRRAWIRRLNQNHPLRFNYFVCFRDVHSPFALQFGHAEWAPVDRPYVQ
jgi:hypothetical protein